MHHLTADIREKADDAEHQYIAPHSTLDYTK